VPVAYTRAALRSLERLPGNVRATILARVDRLAAAPRAFNQKRLKARTGSRLRVGDWRIFFTWEGDVLQVHAVAHRREAYR
jgi:mRNA interferase RelE/StbE